MAFVTSEDVKPYFAAHIGQQLESSVEARYDTLIPLAIDDSYKLIVRKLASKGYSQAQIDDWDEGESFNRDLALCALRPSALGSEASDEWKDRFCRIGELDEDDFVLTIDGEVVDPAESGDIGYGDMERSDDIFSSETKW